MSQGPEVESEGLGASFELPCGVVLKNRLVKAAMSDSLGDGVSGVGAEQMRLYQRWADGGVALSLIGEVQVDHRFPERPGNVVIDSRGDETRLTRLAKAGTLNSAHLWPQLGHAVLSLTVQSRHLQDPQRSMSRVCDVEG